MGQLKHPLIHLFTLLFFLSCLLPLGAISLPRSLALQNKEPPILEVIMSKARMMEEVIERMDIENNDYPGSGANNRHDPKSPGRP